MDDQRIVEITADIISDALGKHCETTEDAIKFIIAFQYIATASLDKISGLVREEISKKSGLGGEQ